MRLFALLLALSAMPALASDAPPPPPPPPPPDAPLTADTPLPPPAPPTDPAEQMKPRSNWARPAAVIGFVSAGAVLLLSVIADFLGAAIHGEAGGVGPDSAVQVVPIVITAAAGPIVYAGGASARWTKSISGSRGLRITGWILYGVSLGLQLLSLYYVPYFRTLAGGVGAGSLVCHAFDALTSGNEAADVAEIADSGSLRMRPTFSLLPNVGGSGGGAVVGLSGAF